MDTYGYAATDWESAKEQARQVMIVAAKNESTITYSELVNGISAIEFIPHDFKLFHLLGQISMAEHLEGRGMLTAVVIRKEDGFPGQGFFDLAMELGLDSADQDKFWIQQLRDVFQAWRNQS